MKEILISSIPLATKKGRVVGEELEALSQRLGRSWKNDAQRIPMKEKRKMGFRKEGDRYSEAAYIMLRNWKKRAGSDATYQVLYDFLCHTVVNRRDLAEEFCVTVGR